MIDGQRTMNSIRTPISLNTKNRDYIQFERSRNFSHPFLSSSQKNVFFYFSGCFSRIITCILCQRGNSSVKAPFLCILLISCDLKLHSHFYPVRQLHHVCSEKDEEDVHDFHQDRSGLDQFHVVMLISRSERTFHRRRSQFGQVPSGQGLFLLLLIMRPPSLRERRLNLVLLACNTILLWVLLSVSDC